MSFEAFVSSFDSLASGSQTDPQNAEDSEYRNIEEEPGDDDGENRQPTIRHSICLTSMLIIKFIIGSSILNLPQIFKTFGIINGICLSIFFNLTSLSSAYLLLKSKDITQRYSFSLYSRITMGRLGTILTKLSLVLMKVSTNCVHFITFSSLLRNIFLTMFGEEHDAFYFKSKFILVILALLLVPLMFQKDISGIARFTYISVIALGILFISTVILFIFKYINDEISPFENKMLYLNKESKISDFFACFGALHNAYVFQSNIFPLYLPLHPRSTKNMLIASLIGSVISNITYTTFGIMGFIMYKYDINDSLINNIGKELLRFIGKNSFMSTVLIICEFAFIINSGFSSILGFYIANKNLIGLLKFIIKKFKNKKNEEDGTQLEDIDEKGNVINKNENLNEEIIGPKTQFFITTIFYTVLVSISLTTTKILGFAHFSGATVSNFICVMSPALFYLYFSRKKNFHLERLMAYFLLLLGAFLILGFLFFRVFTLFY